MGDFAAGKMGAYTGPTGAASAEDVAQALIDLEGLYSSKARRRHSPSTLACRQ